MEKAFHPTPSVLESAPSLRFALETRRRGVYDAFHGDREKEEMASLSLNLLWPARIGVRMSYDALGVGQRT